MTIERLCLLAQADDERAKTTLFHHFDKGLASTVQRFLLENSTFLPIDRRDQLADEAYCLALGILAKCIADFSVDLAIPFEKYVFAYVNRALKTWWRNELSCRRRERPAEELNAIVLKVDEVYLYSAVVLRAAIARLPQRERDIIVAIYFLEFTETEVADQLGITQVRVNQIKQKALSRLRDDVLVQSLN